MVNIEELLGTTEYLTL